MVTSSFAEAKHENPRENWNQSVNRSPALPTQLPARAHLPSIAGTDNGINIFYLVL